MAIMVKFVKEHIFYQCGTPEQAAEQALREEAKLEARAKYLQSELGYLMQERGGRTRSKSRIPSVF